MLGNGVFGEFTLGQFFFPFQTISISYPLIAYPGGFDANGSIIYRFRSPNPNQLLVNSDGNPINK